MPQFYLCSELNCNRKYKTKERMEHHMLTVHKITDGVIKDPIEITQQNKKSEENKRNSIKKHELYELQKKEIERKKELDLQAKKEADELYKQEQIQKYKELELKKLSQLEEKLQLEQKQKEVDEKWVSLIANIQNRVAVNSNCCCICDCNNADTAAIPCGHMHFCFDCIHNYSKTYAHRGCPICRTTITMVAKIFS